MKILIDVDGVIVDTVKEFIEIYNSDLSYWKQSNLYDNRIPLEKSILALKELKKERVELIFCSATFKEHEESKRSFLNRHFPDIGVIFIKNKGEIKADILIDDRECVCKQFIKGNPQSKYFLVNINDFLNITINEVIPYVRAKQSPK